MAQRQRVGFQIQRLGVRIPLGSFLSDQAVEPGWPSGLRRYVQVVVYYVGAGSNPAQCTIFRAIASVAQLAERSAVNR